MACFAIAVSPCVALGAEQVWGFTGTISSYQAGVGFTDLADAPVGTVVRGQFRFDDAVADSNASANEGDYAYIAWALAIEGVSLLHFGLSTVGDIKVTNDLPVGSDFQDKLGISINPSFFIGYPDLGMTVVQADLELTEVSAAAPTVLASDALPATPPPALVNFSTLQQLHVIGYVAPNVADFEVTITEFEEPGTIDLPIIPDDVIVNLDGSVTWVFDTLGISLCASGCWVDPPVSSSFTYAMTNSALFTEIVDFPSGFSGLFEVIVAGTSLGSFGPGDTLDFSGFPGGGVSEFTISGIEPGADLSSAAAFPLQLAFDAPAEFTMTSFPPAVPLPVVPVLVLLVVGIAAGGIASLHSRLR